MKRHLLFNNLILGISKICTTRDDSRRWIPFSFKTLLSLLGFWGLANEVQGQTVTTTDFGPVTYCPGASFSVSYIITGSFNAGNEFRVQLSDASGNFIDGNNSSNIIGSVTSTASGTITATLSATQAAGTGHRVRVVSTNPVVNVTNASDDDNANNITVRSRIITAIYPNPLGPSCVGDPISVPYIVNCNFISSNTFTLQLSDAMGSFDNPITITSVNTTVSGSISGNFPNVPTGNGYRMRIISSNPSGTISNQSLQFRIGSATLMTMKTNGSIYCPGEVLNLTYELNSDDPIYGPNIYSVQLSNNNFANFTNIGSLASTAKSGSIQATVPNNISGTYYEFRIVASNGPIDGCEYGLYSIPASPVVSISSNSPVCAGTTLNLTATGGGTYAWAGPGGFSATSATPTRASMITDMAGIYSVTVSNTFSCTNSAMVSVTVNPLPNINTQPTSQTLSELDNLALTVVASNATVYQWQKDNANFGSSSASPSLNLGPATLGMSGTYKVIVSGACGSATSSPAIVTVTPSVSFATSNGPAVCIGLVIDLKCQRVGTAYTWLGPDGWTSNLKDPSRGNATAAMGGVYSVSVKSGSLVTSATVSVQLVAKNAVSASSNSPVSVGNAIQLSANGGLAFSKTYAWSGPSSFSSTLQNPTRPNAQLTHKGKYIVTFNGACGTATASISVVVNAATRIASSDEDAIDMEISAYPNPVTNTLTVEVRLAKPAALTLELLNGLGEKNGQWKLSEESTQHKTELDLSTLMGGMYLLQAQAGKQKVVKRVVKIQY